MSSQESFLEEINKIKKARKRFIETGEIDSSVVRPIIANSWKRCKLAKVSPFLSRPIIKLKDKEIKILLERNRHLIETSQSIMEMAEKMIKGSEFRIDLSNRDGYILKVIGDKKILEESEKIGVVVGANRSEIIVGTNSIGVTLFTGKPVQIIGPEHYNVYPRYWTCSSAPIRNPSGNIVGVINMSGKYHLLHKHTLGMVVGIANTIESALKIEKKVNELETNNIFLNTIIESIDNALIVMDKKGRITHLNFIAMEILGKKYSEVIEIPINRLIKTNFSLLNILKSKKRYIEREIKVTPFYSKESHKYLLTEKVIEDSTGKPQGIIGLFKEIKKVHRLVGRIVGANPGLNFSNIIGNNKKLKRAISLAKVSSNGSCKILIQGESGTGKEIFAQAIHNYSNRCDKPFIAINCAAIPRDLVESELFGYEEGAFTGARRGGKVGKFELAEGGTLFLDEIEGMPLEAQPKLLRVLESGLLMRVGGSKIIPIDVRIISSSNQDLFLLTKEGKFREDLYYRLSTIIINVPSLRERKDDIPILVKYICNKIGQKLGKNKIEFDKETLKLLCNYNWPGNIRELENVLESAIILSKINCINIDVLPENIIHFKGGNINIKEKKEINSLMNVEKETILEALRESKNNISKTSRTLGIDRSTLYRKIKKFKISK